MKIRELVPASMMISTTLCICPVANASEATPETLAWWPLVMPLLLVVAVGAALLVLVKRRFSGALLPSGPLRVVQVVPVGPRERLLLLEHDGRRLLCGVTAHAISVADLGANGRSAAPDGDLKTSP